MKRIFNACIVACFVATAAYAGITRIAIDRLQNIDACAAGGHAEPDYRRQGAAGALVKPLSQREAGFPDTPGHNYTGEANHLYISDADAPFPRHLRGKQYAVQVPRVARDLGL